MRTISRTSRRLCPGQRIPSRLKQLDELVVGVLIGSQGGAFRYASIASQQHEPHAYVADAPYHYLYHSEREFRGALVLRQSGDRKRVLKEMWRRHAGASRSENPALPSQQ
jgi:hypothetical protein